MTRPVRIGNAHGFWGDRIDAAAEMLAAEPDLDFVTFDFLAEVSMSILAQQQSRHPELGWPRDVLEVIQSLTPYWRSGGRCRLIANAGGLNPLACARACQQLLIAAGCGDRRIAVVTGDDVLEQLRTSPDSPLFRNLDTGESLRRVADRLVTANAYLGAKPIADALSTGGDIVITGRVADPSLTVAACAWFHGWEWDDWNRLAQATVAGHLIECGAQVTGGIATDWLDILDVERIGFPIVEVESDGTFCVTKTRGSGGAVTEQTIKEQLVYEIGDPAAYLSPDATVSFLSLELRPEERDRIRVTGAQGSPSPASYKVSATYQDGFRAQGQLTIYGDQAVAKARRAGDVVIQRLQRRGVTFAESLIECLGAEACHPSGGDSDLAARLRETVLRIGVADASLESVEQFTRELMPLITAGPPGTTGYADGRPRIHPVVRYWPCLIERDRATAVVTLIEPAPITTAAAEPATEMQRVDPTSPTRPSGVSSGWNTTDVDTTHAADSDQHAEIVPMVGSSPAASTTTSSTANSSTSSPRRLADIAHTRSGDKGQNANIGVIARQPTDYELLLRTVTAARVAAFLGVDDVTRVTRYELPNLAALNFVIRGILSNSLRVDAQGKTLGQVLLNLPPD